MKVLLQRVKQASVNVDNLAVGKINKGLLLFVGVEKQDSEGQADFLANKIKNLRIFEDEQGKMNLSIEDVGGEFLVISQFTLVGDTSRGNRPGFDKAARPEEAKRLYEYFVSVLKKMGFGVETGIFQADMQVELINDGPVTFMIEK